MSGSNITFENIKSNNSVIGIQNVIDTITFNNHEVVNSTHGILFMPGQPTPNSLSISVKNSSYANCIGGCIAASPGDYIKKFEMIDTKFENTISTVSYQIQIQAAEVFISGNMVLIFFVLFFYILFSFVSILFILISFFLVILTFI